jgi:hypothetical protein
VGAARASEPTAFSAVRRRETFKTLKIVKEVIAAVISVVDSMQHEWF